MLLGRRGRWGGRWLYGSIRLWKEVDDGCDTEGKGRATGKWVDFGPGKKKTAGKIADTLGEKLVLQVFMTLSRSHGKLRVAEGQEITSKTICNNMRHDLTTLA